MAKIDKTIEKILEEEMDFNDYSGLTYGKAAERVVKYFSKMSKMIKGTKNNLFGARDAEVIEENRYGHKRIIIKAGGLKTTPEAIFKDLVGKKVDICIEEVKYVKQ